MQYLKYKYRFLFLCMLALGTGTLLSSCSKDKEPDDSLQQAGGLTMKVNGESWSSSMTTLLSEEKDKEEFGKYHLVSIMASRIIEKNSKTEDDIAESITLYVAIADSKFKNPKGTYPVVWESNSKVNQSSAVFGTASTLLDADTYVPSEQGQSGTIEITGFEIGDQKVMGHPTGTQGYIKLSGTFNMDLKPLYGKGASKPLKITEGKFNLSGGLGFQH